MAYTFVYVIFFLYLCTRLRVSHLITEKEVRGQKSEFRLTIKKN